MLSQTSQFFIKQKFHFLRLKREYEILDANTRAPIGRAEEEISTPMLLLRLIIARQLLPTLVHIYDASNERVLTLKKSFSFLHVSIDVIDKMDSLLARLKSKMFSLGGGFKVGDSNDLPLLDVSGNWTGWHFKAVDQTSGTEVGLIDKKWAGAAKELFTEADSYFVVSHPQQSGSSLSQGPSRNLLMLAVGIAIDVVFKGKH